MILVVPCTVHIINVMNMAQLKGHMIKFLSSCIVALCPSLCPVLGVCVCVCVCVCVFSVESIELLFLVQIIILYELRPFK